MNSGQIAYRYAKALLKYVQESGSGEHVYSQAQKLVYVISEVPQMSHFLIDASDVSVQQKIALLSAALGEEPDPAIVNFLKMVSTNRRLEYLPRMLWAFIEQYRHANNIKVGSIVTAVEIEGLKERLESLFHEKTGAQVQLSVDVVPDILGGFIFELDGYRVDASVENHLAQIRRKLIEPNNRIV